MAEDEYVGFGEIELLADSRRSDDDADAARQAKLDAARHAVDDARATIASLAGGAVWLIGARLAGVQEDDRGVKITDERIEMAMTVLDRVGIPKLRATAIAASIAHAPSAPAPGAPGWVPPQVEDGDVGEIDVNSVDGMIEAFLAGADAAKKMKGDGQAA